MIADGLRPLTVDDADAFASLRLVGGAAAPTQFRFDPLDDFARSIDKVRDRLVRAHAVGVFEAGKLVGIGCTEPFEGIKLRHKWLLWGMYVAAPGKGYGERIVRALVATARDKDAHSVQLTLVADNHRGRALYERCGFIVYGVEPEAIARGNDFVDELLMWQRLRQDDIT